jgi:hypothetical protein
LEQLFFTVFEGCLDEMLYTCHEKLQTGFKRFEVFSQSDESVFAMVGY